METDLHLKISLRALSTVGQWPLKFKKYSFLNYVHFVYSILVSLYFMFFVITEYIEIANRMNENFLDILNNLSVSLLYTVTMYKVYIIRGSAMSKIVDRIRAVEKTIIGGDDDKIKQIYLSHVDWCFKLSVRFIMITGITLLPFFINPAIVLMTSIEVQNGTVDKPLPFSSWFPFDRNYYYGWSYGMQVFAGMVGGYLTCDTDIFYWALMIFAIGQIKILQYKLTNLSKHAQVFVENGRMTQDEGVSHCLRKCILLHQLIIDYVNDVDDTLKLLMLMDFGICSMQIGVIGFQVIVTGFGLAQMFALEYLLAMLVQMFLFYWHANEIILESLDLAKAIWDGEFYEYSLSIQKSLQFVVLRAQKPLKLKVGPFYSMSTTTAISIVRVAYSYVALMRQVYN